MTVGAAVGVQGEKQRGKDAALRGSGADGPRVRDMFPQLYALPPVRQEVCYPPAVQTTFIYCDLSEDDGSRKEGPSNLLSAHSSTSHIRDALPSATLTVDQNSVFTGEKVTLKCSVESDRDWNSSIWYKDNKTIIGSQPKHIIIGSTLIISSVEESDQGLYWCQGESDSRPTSSSISNQVTITVKALPKSTLNIHPTSPYIGEKVTLTCSVETASDWTRYVWYKDNNIYQNGLSQYNGVTLTIYSVKESDQGLYWCLGERVSRPTSSSISNQVTITVKALPSATLTVDLNPVFTGEKVTLTCLIESESNWRYKWYKIRKTNEITRSVGNFITGNTLIISSVKQSDQGLYWCQGESDSRPTSSSIRNQVTITVKALPKPTLNIHPNSPYIGEEVTLTCSVKPDRYWTRYVWYKDNIIYQNGLSQYNGVTLIIRSVQQPDQGLYWCLGERVSRPTSSSISNQVTITVKALPKPTLKIHPTSPYIGEKVTLTCSMEPYSVWKYNRYWTYSRSKDWNYRTVTQSDRLYITGGNLTISSVDVSDEGFYRCYGRLHSRLVYTSNSDPVTITVKALPSATLTVDLHPVFTGEKVTLTCSVESDSVWEYNWYKDRSYRTVTQSDRLPITGDTLTISSVDVSDKGPYRCYGRLHSRPRSSSLSNQVTMTVKDYQPKATVSSDKEDVLTGDTVTLNCTVESSGWRFYWYRDRPDSPPVTITESTYTFNPVSVSDGGQYWCRAGRGQPPYYTLNSDPVRINVAERPGAVLTLQPNWTQIFIGETVTLRCVLLGGGDTDWRYEYFHYQNIIQTEPEYRISTVRTSQSGSYRCKGVKGSKFSSLSDVVQLTVSAKPKPVLSISPQWLNPGDSVTLRCQVKETSTDWRFFWYKTVPLNQSYSLESLSVNGTTEEYYTLSPAGHNQTGGYVCRAGRGDPFYYTHYSEPQYLWSGDLQSAVSLTVNSKRTQHFTKTSVSLSCEEKGLSNGWRLMRSTDRGTESGCVSFNGTIEVSTCNISYTQTEDSGVYWCESGSGENSNAVNITVTDGPVILESSVHPVTEGDTVTLVCKRRTTISNITKADFYKDGEPVRNETAGQMTIPVVSKSDEGFYKCKSNKGESPGSWVMVGAPGSSTSVLVGVTGGLVFTGVLLVVVLVGLLVLFCKYKHDKGSCCTRTSLSPQTQITNQDPQQDLLQHDGANIYEAINSSDNLDKVVAGSSATGTGDVTYAQIQLKQLHKKKKVVAGSSSATGTGDVTYAQIELKQLHKKKKGKPDKPNENTIYSEVQKVKESASGPVDVTYAEIDLKKMTKKKKRGSTPPPEPEPVYSLLQPGTGP